MNVHAWTSKEIKDDPINSRERNKRIGTPGYFFDWERIWSQEEIAKIHAYSNSRFLRWMRF